MVESLVLPWTDESEERVASTWDIKQALKTCEEGSFTEFSLCYEAAHDVDRPLDEKTRYLLATYGKEYATDPVSIDAIYDDIAKRAARNVGKYAIIQKSPRFLMFGRLADPNLQFQPMIGRAANVPMGFVSLAIAGRINTIVDNDFNIVPELSRDFVEWAAAPVTFKERGTDVVRREDGTFERCEHNGDTQTLILGDEVEEWLSQNPAWTEHVDNMMSAYTTGGVNIPVAELKLFDSSLSLV